MQKSYKTTGQLALAGIAVLAMTAPQAQAMPNMMPMAGMPNVMIAPPSEIRSAVDSNLDKLFMLHAAQGNMFEVESGKLALRKSRNAGVRMVAMTIIKGHSAGQKSLMTHFRANNMMMPKTLSPMGMATIAMLKKLKGSAFDKAFMAGQVEAHENTIVLFEHEAMMGQNAGAKSHATNQLPGILGHTAQIYNVAKMVNAPGINMRPASLTQLSMTKMGKMGMMKH